MANEIDPRILPQLTTNPTTRRRFLGGGGAAAAALALGPSFLAACSSKNQPGTISGPTIPSDDGKPATGKLRISNWPFYMADGFVAAFQTATGLTVDYKEDYNDNEEWFAKNKEPLSRKQDIGADLVVPTQFMAVRLNGLGWLNGISESRLDEQEEYAPRPAERQRRSRPQVQRPLHVRHGRTGLQPGVDNDNAVLVRRPASPRPFTGVAVSVPRL